ncbi:MAG: hypothetical protein FWG90_00990 [Oscillospiraceae bacterium]|nr:hypothetical protein [Oscillospiraceae bacterium]
MNKISLIYTIESLIKFFEINLFTTNGIKTLNKLAPNANALAIFESIYVQPYFEMDGTKKTAEKENEILEPYNKAKRKIDKENDKNKNKEFIKRIANGKEPLQLIYGRAGSGKSTYINRILSHIENKSEYIKAIIEDENDLPESFETIRIEFNKEITKVRGFGKDWGLFDANEPVNSSFELIILHSLIESLDGIFKNKEKINSICKNFRELFNDAGKLLQFQIDFFDDLKGLLKLPAPSQGKLNILGCKLIKGIRTNGSEKPTLFDVTLRLLEIYILLLHCENPKMRYVLLFDGIEVIIDTPRHFFDNNVVFIVETIRSFCANLGLPNNQFIVNGDNIFESNFVFVLPMRDTTKRFFDFDTVQEQTGENIQMDVTAWFDTSLVYEKHLQIFKNHCSHLIHSDFTIIENILKIVMNDIAYKPGNGLMEWLEPMFNYDKRRLMELLLKSINLLLKTDNAQNFIGHFLNYWTYYENTPMGERVYCYRYLCRRAIVRIILRYISINDKNCLLNRTEEKEKTNNNKEKVSSSRKRTHIRKILLYLSSFESEYLDFTTLKNLVLRTTDGDTIDKDHLDNFINTLYYLGDYELHIESWHQFIIIKFNDSRLEKLTLPYFKQKMLEFDDGSITDDEKLKFGFKISDTGDFYIWFQPEFELFACKFCREYPLPLIFYRKPEEIISVINEVYKNVCTCIRIVLRDEYNSFHDYSDMKNQGYLYKDKYGNEIPFPKRIIMSHIEYLEHYLTFVEGKSSNESKCGEFHS